ncbi:MAG: carbohydrate kinase family protein [bacterium]
MKEGKRIEAVCGGIVVADVIVSPVTALPPRGKMSIVSAVELHVGGCAANTAVALARLGAGAAVVGRAGDDHLGTFLRCALEREGVDCRALATDPSTPTSATTVVVAPDGERSFIHVPGANEKLRARDFPLERFPHARLLHLGGPMLNGRLRGAAMKTLLRTAREAGMITSIDAVWNTFGRWLDFVAPALPFTDYFFANEAEARMITGRGTPGAAARFLLERGAGTAVIKMGPRGSAVFTRGGRLAVPAYPARCLDTTGAGDAYVGGFLYGVLKGWGLERAASLASAAGAMCVTAVGASAGLKGLAETLNFMKKQNRKTRASFPARHRPGEPPGFVNQ